MHIIYPNKDDFLQTLKEANNESYHFIVIITAAFDSSYTAKLKACLDQCVRILKNGGLLFVQGRPDHLSELGVYLDKCLVFKHWIAIESVIKHNNVGLPSAHAAMLLFSKGNNRFNVKRIRFPHQYCDFCKKTLRDWGGKTHLMHPDGYVISDVWTELPRMDNYNCISDPAIKTILRMLDFKHGNTENMEDMFQGTGYQDYNDAIQGIIGPKEGLYSDSHIASEEPVQFLLPGLVNTENNKNDITDNCKYNVVYLGDAIEILKNYPDNSIDLAFADPPYNLEKSYSFYDDEKPDEEYINWCNLWLNEYIRILKPRGSLYILNLPRWAMHHAVFLNKHLYFQNWIVWDALSEPRGKILPAHYSLLFYTKHPTNFTFNYSDVGTIDARSYCLRPSCLHKRKSESINNKEILTDIWWDIHRIKHQRYRDYHPCQLPEALMERIIRLSTNKGDIVVDAFCGVGTTPITAFKLGRRYIAIDIDKEYVEITKRKIAELEQNGYVERKRLNKKIQRKYTKKELQLELRALAAELGRLPTPEDVKQISKYDLEVFLDAFPTWSKALKAAKIEVNP